jgi:hypothetical protein
MATSSADLTSFLLRPVLILLPLKLTCLLSCNDGQLLSNDDFYLP